MSDPTPTWVTGTYARRSGAACYVHLIRAPDDPERRPRPAGGLAERAPHRRLAKTPAAQWEPVLLAALEDGVPRTFNRLGVELFDLTADVLCTTPVDTALWSLVAQGLLEHTLRAPILFRLRKGAPLLVAPQPAQQLSLFPYDPLRG